MLNIKRYITCNIKNWSLFTPTVALISFTFYGDD